MSPRQHTPTRAQRYVLDVDDEPGLQAAIGREERRAEYVNEKAFARLRAQTRAALEGVHCG